MESRRVREPRRTSAIWFTVSCVTVMGLVSGLSLASHSDSRSFLWHTRYSAKMHSKEKDSGRFVGHRRWRLLSPFDFS